MGEFENKFKGVLPKLHERYQNDNPVAFLVFKTAERFYLDQQSKIEQLEKEKAEITRLVQSLRNEFDVWDYCPQVERQIELLEKACRGES